MSNVNQIFRPSKTRRLVSAWIVNGSQQHALQRVKEFDDIFDQVIFMCGATTPDGGLPADWSVEERKRLNAEFRAMGVSTLNDYGGGGKDGCVEMCRNPKSLQSCIQNMVEECEKTESDGVDIDFEGWPADSRYAYNDFIAGLSEALHTRGKMLSICTYALSPAARRETGIGFWDTSVLAHYADHLRAMTYDLFAPPSQFIGPTSTAPWGRETMAYMATQVPRHKIVMGLPTYSVDWDINDPTRSRQVYDYKWIAEREKESPIGRGWCYGWDVNLIRYNDAENHAHLMWVSDAMSTRSHLVTVDSNDLAGVCFWVLTEDDPAIWEAVRQHFRRSV